MINRLNREQQKIKELETELKILKKQVSEKDEVIEMPDKQSKNLSASCPDHRG